MVRRRFNPLARGRRRGRPRPCPTLVPGATPVGVLDGVTPAEVDGAGGVHIGPVVLRPWVGAEDRWHRLDREVAVRQRLVGDVPVVETLLRVPGGDVVWRVFGARPAGGGEALVVELENGTRSPVALAVAVEPATSRRLRLEGPALWLDDRVRARDAAVLVAPRPPSLVAVASDLDTLFELVSSGAAGDPDDVPPSPAGGQLVAVLHPVTHGTTLTLVVPLSGPPPAAGALGGLPPADAVSRGWRRQLGAASVADVPDPNWSSALAAGRAQLLLGAAALAAQGPALPGDESPGGGTALAAAARALDGWGHHHEASHLLAVLTADLATTQRPEVAAAFLSALHLHWHLTGDAALPPAAVEDIARAVALIDRALRQPQGGDGRASTQRSALAGASRLLAAAGQLDASAAVHRLATDAVTGPVDPGSEEVDRLLQLASPTWTWSEPWLAARVLLGARAALVGGEPEGRVEVLPGWREAWRGAGVEVHGLPLGPRARLSYALRWHGERPALLWEVEAEGAPTEIVLGAPALDPSWVGLGARGEALLQAPPARPGPTLAPPSADPAPDPGTAAGGPEPRPLEDGPDEFS